MRRAIIALGLSGALLCAGACLASFAQPLLVERAARELVRIEVQQQVEERLGTLSNPRIAAFAQRALHRTDAEMAETQRAIREGVAGKVAEVAANAQVRGSSSELVESAYASVAQNLLREFRIFTGVNALAFALLALVALVRKQAKLQLLLPALVIVGAVAVTGSLYLFNQDWLHTLVFGDYVGWGYVAWLSGVALLLADILMNRARVSTLIVNGLAALVGATATAMPC